ncbi:hypothetical protein PV336_27255 [Streptomyces sp. MI02-2A]|nr:MULTISPECIES: hypothetical protein [unclassified Streptomyces]MDX3262881.1 hypothetical protein [Streptomyces sp. MI02-2A]
MQPALRVLAGVTLPLPLVVQGNTAGQHLQQAGVVDPQKYRRIQFTVHQVIDPAVEFAQNPALAQHPQSGDQRPELGLRLRHLDIRLRGGRAHRAHHLSQPDPGGRLSSTATVSHSHTPSGAAPPGIRPTGSTGVCTRTRSGSTVMAQPTAPRADRTAAA